MSDNIRSFSTEPQDLLALLSYANSDFVCLKNSIDASMSRLAAYFDKCRPLLAIMDSKDKPGGSHHYDFRDLEDIWEKISFPWGLFLTWNLMKKHLEEEDWIMALVELQSQIRIHNECHMYLSDPYFRFEDHIFKYYEHHRRQRHPIHPHSLQRLSTFAYIEWFFYQKRRVYKRIFSFMEQTIQALQHLYNGVKKKIEADPELINRFKKLLYSGQLPRPHFFPHAIVHIPHPTILGHVNAKHQ